MSKNLKESSPQVMVSSFEICEVYNLFIDIQALFHPFVGINHRTILFIRLFCITGLIWTLKAVPLLFLPDLHSRRNGIFWSVMNFLSDSYGVVIFIAFVFNKR